MNSSQVLLRLFFCFSFFISCFEPLTQVSAQDLDNVTISGRVIDQNGAVIPGATIIAAVSKTGANRTTVTDASGRYRIIQLGTGVYTLIVSSEGFAPEVRENIPTLAGQHVQFEITLRPQAVTTNRVTVTASDAPSVDTTRTVVGATITAQEFESLPVATRSPLDLIFTLAGVTEEPLSTRELAEDRDRNSAGTPEEAGMFALSGGPAYSNNLTIDGLDNNDDRAARERFQPSMEAVEEVQVITNQFSSEYGRASGGRVNIRTRGGAKQFSGRAFYFFKDESLNANTYRNNFLGLKRLPLQEHNPGFTLSGPLMFPGHRTFFFSAYEFTKVLDSALVDTLVPVRQSPRFRLPPPSTLQGRRLEDVNDPMLKEEIAPLISSINTPIKNHIFTTRVDHHFNEKHNGSLLYQLGRLSNLRQFGGGNRLAEALQAKIRNSDAISFSENYVASDTLINQLRLQFSRLAPAVETHGGTTPVVLITINDPLMVGNPARRSGSLIAGSSTTGATDRRENRVQMQNTLSYVRGNHSLKFGFDIQRISSTFIDLSDASGTFNFASAGDFLAGIPSRFRQNFRTESTQQNIYTGLFAHDEWRVGSRLVFSFGLRYENESIIRDRNNIAPRFSVAYDPFNTGKTVIRLGAGVFYNRALLRTIDDFTLGTQQLFFDTNTLRNTDTGKLMNADERRRFIADNISFPQTLNVASSLVKQFGLLNTGFSRQLGPSLRIPESYQTNVGLERELGGKLVLEVNYTWNRGIHLWREFNVNAPVLPAGYQSLTDYLVSRDFANFLNGQSGTRPIYNASTAGELIRFVLTSTTAANPNTIGRTNEFGVPVSLFNLNSLASTTVVEVALAALNDLRPDPARAEVEQLISVGNSFYDGLTLELRGRTNQGQGDFGLSFRAAYTLSRLIDDGVVNTSDALTPGNFRHERSRSLLDRRHRFVFSGTLDTPRLFGSIRFAPILRIASGAPFNISLEGIDRNLDDVSNDRPNFTGDVRLLRWRSPGQAIDPSIIDRFSLPPIGQTGNLPRNAGTGPGLFDFDLSITREFRLGERVRLRPIIEFDNVLNKTVFSFGSEFINFSALASTATDAQRQAFLESFLVATQTLRARQVRLGIRFDF